MNEQLKAHLPKVRVNEKGEEVEKPKATDFCIYSTPYCESEEYPLLLEAEKKYNNATEVIKLPTLNEFCKVLRANMEDITVHQVVDLIHLYIELIETDLQLGQFIPCKDGKPLEEPNDFKDYSFELSVKNGRSHLGWSKECYEYQTAKEAVIFYGWRKDGLNNLITNGEMTIAFSENQISLTDDDLTPINTMKTISDLIPFGVYLKTNV